MINKKIWIIIGMIVLLIMVLIIFWFPNKNKSQNTIIKVSQENTVNVEKITYNQLFFPFIKQDSSIVGLYNLGRYFYQYNPNSTELKQISNKEILSPVDVIYSPNGSKAIVVSLYPTTNIKLYDLVNNKISELSNNILQIVWSKNEDKIYYSYRDASKNIYQIDYSKPDGGDWHILADGAKEIDSFEVSPDESKIIYYKELTEVEIPQSYIYDINSKKKTTLDKNIDITKAYWSPNSQRIAYLDRNNHLSVIDNDGGNNFQTNVVLSGYINKWYVIESNEDILSESMLWKDKDNLVLAIPDNLNEDPLIAQTSLYIYNIPSKQLTKLNTSNQSFNGVSLISIHDNKTLYFTSNDYLYKADLP